MNQAEQLNERLLKRITEVREQYEANPRKDSFNALVYGDFGTGKSALARTCRLPVLIHSFDPGGTKTKLLQPMIKSGQIMVDARFEQDRWKDATAFRLWEREIENLKSIGMFNNIGTYVLDSMTRWADCMMYEIIKTRRIGKSGTEGSASFNYQLQDYNVQQVTGVDWLGDLMNLPCDVIVTGHIGLDKDEVTGQFESGVMLAGKFSAKVPLVFDEKYISKAMSGSSGKPEYKLQTHTVGIYKAETRIGGDSFDTYEEPNIKRMLAKAGRKVDDKPSFIDLLGSKQDMPKV